MPDSDKPCPPSREGRRNLTVWLPTELLRSLRHIGVETDRPLQDLVEEGVAIIVDRYRSKKNA